MSKMCIYPVVNVTTKCINLNKKARQHRSSYRSANVYGGGIHQSFLDEKLEMISSLDFLQFTIHNHDSAKSTTQKHDPENLSEL